LSSIKYGSTTFNLPDCNNRVLQGGDRGYKEAGLPNIEGTLEVNQNQITGYSGAMTIEFGTGYVHYSGTTSGSAKKIGFDASLSSSIYGNSDTVQPPALCLNMIIKI
jgi:hypothetical protein